MAEKHEVKSILTWLRFFTDAFAWRVNTGAVVFSEGAGHGSRFVRFGFAGVSDIIGLLPDSGRFLAIEVKSAKGKQTPAQRDFQHEIESHGGIYILARGVPCVIERFKQENIPFKEGYLC